MHPPADKSILKTELLERLRGDLESQERAFAAAKEGATHEEAKPENDKDTRALEQSYLARGQAVRLEETRAGVADVESLVLRSFEGGKPAALGALVVAEEGDDTLHFFLVPYGGGLRIDGGRVQVVTPKSPLGASILGKREGDDTTVTVAGRVRELTIVDVR